MTSFSKALYRRDPAAAEAFHKAQQFEHRITYGKSTTLACFTPAGRGLVPAFGKRVPTGETACATNCRHPACTNGCTLRNGGSR